MKQQLKIVHVIDQLNIGGAERVVVTLCNIFAEKGYQVKVVTILDQGLLAKDLHSNIEIVALHRTNKWSLKTMRQLVKEFTSYDVVHVHSSFNLRYTFLACKLFGFTQKLFYHEHYGFASKTKASWHQKIIYPQTIFIAVSKALAAWAIKEVGVSKKNVFQLPNIVVQEIIDNQKQNKQTEKKLLVVSNFLPVKNIEFALEIIKELKKKIAVTLTIVGQKHDEEYYKKIINKIETMHLKNNVLFIHDCTNVQQILGNYDVAMHTSTSESGPLVLVEYLSQGLPFLTYKTGEVVEQIKLDIPQNIIDNFSLQEWVSRLMQLLENNLDEVNQKSKLIYNKYYSVDSYYDKCVSIYNYGLSKQIAN